MKEILGKKSLGYQHLLGVVGTALLGINIVAIIIYFIDSPNDLMILFLVFIIIPILVCVLCGMWWVQQKKPYAIITYEDENLYLNLPLGHISIPFDQIIQVIPERSHGRGISYTFGRIIIQTEEERYKVGIISQVEDVSLSITRLVREKNHH